MTVTATYRNGAFVPDSSISLPGDVEARALANLAVLEARFPGSIGSFTHEEAKELRRAIGDAFEQVDDERDC